MGPTQVASWQEDDDASVFVARASTMAPERLVAGHYVEFAVVIANCMMVTRKSTEGRAPTRMRAPSRSSARLVWV